MKYVEECKAMLEQLKKDHPLPETVRMKWEFQPVTFAKIGNRRGGGGLITLFGLRLPIQYVTIAVAMECYPRTLEGKLRIVAHEYRHALQAFVLGTYTNTSSPLDPSEDDANAFARAYVEEYMTKTCMK